jgi:arylsulfatase A
VMYWEFPTQGGQQAVRIGRYKGVRRGIASGKAKIEVYDLQADVGEATDVAAQHPEIAAQVTALFNSEHTPSKLFPLPGVDPGPVPGEKEKENE